MDTWRQRNGGCGNRGGVAFAFVLLACSNASEPSAQGRDPGAACSSCTRDLEAARTKLTAVEAEVTRLRDDNARLSSTDQGIFAEATRLAESGDVDGALAKFRELRDRFPTSPLVAQAATKEQEFEGQRIAAGVREARDALDDSDRTTYEASRDQLVTLARSCSQLGRACSSSTEIRRLSAQVAGMLRDWPVDITSIRESTEPLR